MNIFSLNLAGIQSKLSSFKQEIRRTNSALFTAQETHYATKGKASFEGFEVFETIRKHKEKGGTMIGAHKALKPVLITQYDDTFELLVIEINVANKDVRVISGYGPQENFLATERVAFYEALEEEIIKAELSGKSIIVEADFNAKLGQDFIPNDPHNMSPNGKLLSGIIRRQNLTVLNGHVKCVGTITRERDTTNVTQRSAISFVLVSEDLVQNVESVLIDEKQEFAPTRITKTKNAVEKKESDHNVILTRLKLEWSKYVKEETNNLFNLKNKDGQKMFKEATTNNNEYLSKVFSEESDLNTATEKFLKKLNKVLHKCFRKIEIKKTKRHALHDTLYNRWREVKTKLDPQSKQETIELEEKLANEYLKKVEDAAKEIECDEGGVSTKSLWDLKKKLCPQVRDPPTAMVDDKGNLVKSDERIKELAIKTFQKRLENRPMKEELKHIKEGKEKLALKLMDVAKKNKTPPWTMNNLMTVLRQLKKNKSRDPLGLANEVFKPDVAGEDLKEAVLQLMNRIKDEQVFPKVMEMCNVSPIWKKKGPINQYSSYRGIFRVTILRSILDKLIYNDEYEKLDKNMTDCNVGGRKFRNIRDNIFALNAILNSARNKHEESHDIQIYDVETCFDALWLHEVILCLYEAGMKNDKLPLLFLENVSAQVAAKTSSGLSSRVTIREIIMQGSVWGSLCCVVLMEKLGKLVYSKPELLYLYKGVVEVPTLQMVDDILGVQKCSLQSVQLNSVVNTFMDLEKLTLNKNKCHKLHTGKEKRNCPDLMVHANKMKETKTDKYLGDTIDSTGKIKQNIKLRIAKGHSRVKVILAMLKESPLGWTRVKAGLVLRKAMLINGIMFNSESWHGVVEEDIRNLERVDEALLRGLVSGHAGLPLPSLYLALGVAPLRHIWAARRIMYLQTILKRNNNEMTKKMYIVQKTNKTKGDFYELVWRDIKMLELNLTEQQICDMKKSYLKKLIKQKVADCGFRYLMKLKEPKSKMNSLQYSKLELEPYFQSPLFKPEQAAMLMALRTRTVRGIHTDFGEMYADKSCPLKCGYLDTLENLPRCGALQHCIKDDQKHIEYRHVYASDMEQQKAATTLYTQLMDTREKLLDDARQLGKQ